ncbi:MAG: caspase family protein [Nitrospinae bacterium]|nr:caspase family protein [Nitrospinota bacterium]
MLKKILLVSAVFILLTPLCYAEKGSLKIGVLPAPPDISATVSFSEPSGNNILDADETGKLIITVQNNGRGDAFDVRADITVDRGISGLIFDRTVSLGTVPHGQSMTKEVELRASEDIPTSEVKFGINIKEANGFDANPMKVTFNTKAFEPPKLVVADIGIDDQNGNSRVEPMEMVEVTARVQNIGHGDARGVGIDIEIGENVFIAGDGISHFDIGSISAGKFKDIKFMFYTNKRIQNGERIPVSIRINEARPQFKTAKALDFTMNAPQKRTQEIIVKGVEELPKGEIQVAGGLSVDVDMKIPDGKKAGEYDVAVVIGNKLYSATAGIPDVEFADRDARTIKEYLIKTFGFKPENIIYAENATVGKFNEIFGSERDFRGKLFNFIRKDVSEVFIYYVGHGAPDLQSQEAYFVPVDANPQYIASNGYRLQTFYENLSKLPAKKITIVLDACFSGNSDKGLIFKNISPAVVKVKKEYRGPANALIITSAAVDQVSTWYPDKRHSLFTYYFLKGLQGDADANKDKAITIGEMREYLKENVPYMARRLNNVEQHPVIDGDEKEVLVRIKN